MNKLDELISCIELNKMGKSRPEDLLAILKAARELRESMQLVADAKYWNYPVIASEALAKFDNVLKKE